MGKVYLVASGKGGTGKTMFSANLGYTMAEAGYRVLLLDMDMGLRNLDLYLGLENNVVYDVSDVLRGICRIKQGLIKAKNSDNLYYMAASPQREEGDITPLHLSVLCEKLKKTFDYVIIDAPSGIDDGLVVASAGADEAILVTLPEYASVRDADTLDKELGRLGIEKRSLIINKVNASLISQGLALSIADICNIIRVDMLGIIQEDENIHISTNIGIPIVCKEGTYIRENFKKIVERLTNN